MAQWSGQFGSGPAFDYIVDINEIGRTSTSATLRVQLRLKLHGSNSATFFGYPVDWHCSSSGANSGWMQVKTSARWYGGQDYRSYTYDLTIGADNSSKTVGVNVQTRTPGYSLSTGAMNQNFNFTISSRNSPPRWLADDTHMVAWGQTLKYDCIIPENTDEVIIWIPEATDNEQGGNLNYDLHRYINGNYSAQLQYGGSNRRIVDHIGNWGAGSVFKYEAKVHDGELWADRGLWSWVYTKNRFSPATVGNVGSIGPNQNTLTFTAFTARNQGGICNNEYGYRITSLTPGVNVYGNREYGSSSQTDVHFVLGVKNNGGDVPTNPHWLDANEIKNYLAGSGYHGTIRLRVESWNSYGSSGSADFNVNVDLRKDVPYTTITHNSGWIRYNNANYYLPGYLPIDLSWGAVTDPMGGNVTYDVLYQIGDGAWTFLASTGSATTYRANLASSVGNIHATNFRFIVKAKTSYGKESSSGGPRVELHNYDLPTVRITKIERGKTTAKITGSIQINTSITQVVPTSANYRLNGANPTSFMNVINTAGGNPFAYSFDTTEIDVSKAYSISLTVADNIRTLLEAAHVNIGWGNGSGNIPVFIPTVALRKNGVGINSLPASDSALTVNGRVRINGNVIDRVEEGVYRFGQNMTEDEQFYFGSNSIGVYNNAGNNNVTISRERDESAPNNSKYVLKVSNRGPAAPGLGGFTWSNGTYKGAVFTYIMTIKIPVGHDLNFASNAYGDQGRFEWITPNQGTGKWETYIGRAYCGTTGSFNSIGYFWINGNYNCDWYVARATYYDNTQAPYFMKLKTLKINEGGTNGIGSIVSSRDTLLMSGKIETMLSSNMMFDGRNYIHQDKTKGASQIIMTGSEYPKYRWSMQGDPQFGICQFSSTYDVLTSYYKQQVVMQRGNAQDANRDFNEIVDSGIFATYMDGMANKPGGDAMYPYGLLIVFNSGGVVAQLWLPHSGSHSMHYRVRWDSGYWTNWANVGWSQ